MRNEHFKQGTKEYDLWHGDQPEQVSNDNGYGYKIEHPALPCASGHCPAKFWGMSSRNAHIDFRHSESPLRQSQNDELANDYRGPGER
jgi:hypothetical protein